MSDLGFGRVSAGGGWVEDRVARSAEAHHSGGRQLVELNLVQLAGLFLAGLGTLALLLLGCILELSAINEQRAQHGLLQAITADPAATYNLALGAVPAKGRPVAVLQIPTLGLLAAVVQGSTETDLQTGPGHMPTTPLPGQPGNAVLAGRRSTFGAPFGRIGTLRPGDGIRVVDGYGQFRYRVVRVELVGAGQRDVVGPTSDNRLTLVTANSSLFPTGRLAVVADQIGKPVAGARTPSFGPAPNELGLEGDNASGVLALLWFTLLVALVGATAWSLRRWSQPVVVYLLAVPVVLVVLLFTWESIVGFLPATV